MHSEHLFQLKKCINDCLKSLKVKILDMLKCSERKPLKTITEATAYVYKTDIRSA